MGAFCPLEEEEERPRGGDGRLPELAARQYGVVSAGQLAALGFTRNAIAARVDAGRLHRVHRGVYAVGHPGLGFQARCFAAVMAAGPDAVLSHGAAAALWSLRHPPRDPLDVTTPRRTRHGPAGIMLHRVRHPPEATHIQGIPVTTVPRTVLDLGATTSSRQLERIIREALATRAATQEELHESVARAGSKPGAPALRRALGHERGSRSPLERRFLALCRRARLEPPLVNAVIAGLEVDFLWTGPHLVVETDGFATHATRHGFERDRQRDAILARAGLRVLRFTDRQIAEREGEVLEALRAAGVSLRAVSD